MDASKHTEPSLRKPPWLKIKPPGSGDYLETLDIAKRLNLNTVCEEASCPNLPECWSKRHTTVMILGSICTRACTFCNIKTGVPEKVDPYEPYRLAEAVAQLKLEHVVITSVDRDDLPDGGARHFVNCINAIREKSPSTTIEILTPDFLRKDHALEVVVEAKPDIYNHNIETVPSLYPKIKPGARYFHSLNLLYRVKSLNDNIFTKSGIMVGLGETNAEILQVMDDLRAAKVDFLTIGQYLPPSPKHAKLQRYVHPEDFEYYYRIAKTKGFLMVASSPFTRSSYHASEDFTQLKLAKLQQNK